MSCVHVLLGREWLLALKSGHPHSVECRGRMYGALTAEDVTESFGKDKLQGSDLTSILT